MPKKKNKQAIKDNNDDDKPNRMPKKKNKQAKPDNVNSEGKGKGNSNDNDNDEDDKKNPDRGAKKKIDKQKKTKKMAKVTKVVERIIITRESRLKIMARQNPNQTRKQTGQKEDEN